MPLLLWSALHWWHLRGLLYLRLEVVHASHGRLPLVTAECGSTLDLWYPEVDVVALCRHIIRAGLLERFGICERRIQLLRHCHIWVAHALLL